MTLPDIPVDLITSPLVQKALEDFIVEAIDEATDMLATGDLSTRTALIKMVLAGALKAKDSSNAGEAEKVYAQARAVVSGILEDD